MVQFGRPPPRVARSSFFLEQPSARRSSLTVVVFKFCTHLGGLVMQYKSYLKKRRPDDSGPGSCKRRVNLTFFNINIEDNEVELMYLELVDFV